MIIKLTQDQIDEMMADEYLEVDAGDYRLYMELQSREPWYFEIIKRENGKTVTGFAFDKTELQKMDPLRPYNRFNSDNPCCTSCGTEMIYKFEYCPRCGQRQDWSKE